MQLTLPDSEMVTYVYDAGGNLKSFAGDKQGVHTNYPDTLYYDKFEQRSYLKLGNGVETTYSYDPEPLSRILALRGIRTSCTSAAVSTPW